VDGHTCIGALKEVVAVPAEVSPPPGRREYRFSGGYADDPSIVLELVLRVADESRVVRFRYMLRNRGMRRLTTDIAKVAPPYLDVSFAGMTAVTERVYRRGDGDTRRGSCAIWDDWKRHFDSLGSGRDRHRCRRLLTCTSCAPQVIGPVSGRENEHGRENAVRAGISMWSLVPDLRAGRTNALDFIRYAAGNGCEGVEIVSGFWREGIAEPQQAKALAAELNVVICGYAIGNDFVQADAAERSRQLGHIRGGVDMAVTLGTPYVRVFGGDVKPAVPVANGYAWIIEGLRAGAAYAAKHGVTLVLENSGQYAGRADQAGKIILDVNSSSLRANADTGNFLLAGQDPVEGVRDLAPLTVYVHLKDLRPLHHDEILAETYTAVDGSRFTGAVNGTGVVPMRDVLSTLRDAGYDGWLTIEYEGPGNAEQETTRSLHTVQALLQDMGACG
jgi:sugar phosphate isomerase/epimerase